MISKLIEINCYLVLMVGVYYLIRQFISASSRRGVILSLFPLALLISLIRSVSLSYSHSFSVPTINLDIIQVGNHSAVPVAKTYSFLTLENLYWLVVSIFIFWSVIKVFRAFVFFRNGIKDGVNKVLIKRTSNPSSFSFFNYIHLSDNLSGEDYDIILRHELLHVKYKHTFDLLLMEVYHAFLWFNPVIILLKRELICIHEYQVDHQMYTQYNKEYIMHLMASTLGVNSSQLLLTSQFYNGLSLAQRVKHMKTKRKNNWKLLAIIPVFATGLIFVSFTSNKPVLLTNVELSDQDSVFNSVEVSPEFPGGQSAMIEFIVSHMKYPEAEKKKGIEGKVYCSFVVTKTGKIEGVKIVRSLSEALDKEVIRVVNSMPNWVPGEVGGKKVNTRYVMPVQFALDK